MNLLLFGDAKRPVERVLEEMLKDLKKGNPPS